MAITGLALMTWLALSGPATAASGDAARGKYLFAAAGCQGCHTDVKNKGKPLAGGREMKTPFGTYFSPNITPDKETGIGNWSDADFIRALRDGVSPDGSHYFPVFPYPSYTGMTDRDMLDVKAYIFTTPTVRKTNTQHRTLPPFGTRFLIGPWKALYFDPGPYKPDPAKSKEWNRGNYLVNALGHCGECHTPRNAMGAMNSDMALAGTSDGPEGGLIPNITPDKETGIGKWPEVDLKSLLDSGMLPDGDFVGSDMGEVVDRATSKLTKADLKAMITYLRAVPPIHNTIESKKKK